MGQSHNSSIPKSFGLEFTGKNMSSTFNRFRWDRFDGVNSGR